MMTLLEATTAVSVADSAINVIAALWEYILVFGILGVITFKAKAM